MFVGVFVFHRTKHGNIVLDQVCEGDICFEERGGSRGMVLIYLILLRVMQLDRIYRPFVTHICNGFILHLQRHCINRRERPLLAKEET
jgi:hypothetical protein